MSRCCIVKSITIVNSSGGGSPGVTDTLYSANGTLSSNRTVNANAKSLTFNMGNSPFLVSGVITTKGVELPNQSSNPYGTATLWTSGINLYYENEPLSLLPVAVETSGTVSASLNYLTPINTASVPTTVSPPSGLTVNSRFEIVDSRGNAETNNILINFSGAGQKLFGSSTENYTMNGNGAFARFRYLGATIGWVIEK